MSDALCRQATGGGFATRTLYSDEDETIIDTKRPIMVNGIENVIHRHDMADRSIVINLAVISEGKRIDEASFWREFEDDAPEIFGAFLDAVSACLRNYKSVKLPQLPRMADFAIWATAAETALDWDDGSFLKSYSTNRREVTAMTLEADQVGTTVKKFMEARGFSPWEGTASELLDALDEKADERTKKSKGWPRSANGLSGKLKRSATALRTECIEIIIGRNKKQRTVRLEKVGKKIVTTVTGSDKEAQDVDIVHEREVTMFDDEIVTSGERSSPGVKDRHLFQNGDDAVKKIVTDIQNKKSVNKNSYKAGDDDDGGDDVSSLLFKISKTALGVIA